MVPLQQKLQNLPPILYINLNRQPKRKAFFEKQLEDYGITNYTRIEAYDGKKTDLREYLVGAYPKDVTSEEIGCDISHLKAINHFVHHTTYENVLVCEDDLSLEMVTYWDFSWDIFYSHLPLGWDVIQLVVDNPRCLHFNMHTHFVNDYSTACYLISRRYAEKLLSLHCLGDTYKLDQNIKPKPVADALIYNSGRAYAIALFTTILSEEGAINEATYFDQQRSNNFVSEFWRNPNKPSQFTSPMVFEYDPFVGSLPPEVYINDPHLKLI